MESVDYTRVMVCLEQKNLLMKDIMNLTKRIEVGSKQEEPKLDGLLAERQNRIDRLIKCDKLISDELSSLSEDQKAHMRDLLAGKEDVAEDDDERKMVEFVLGTKKYLERALQIEKSAMDILLQKREEARLALVEISNENGTKDK